jgi:hypothetical protein
MRPLICGFADLQQINVLLTMQRNWDTKLAKFLSFAGGLIISKLSDYLLNDTPQKLADLRLQP